MKRIWMLLFLLLTLGSIIGMPSRAAQPEKKIGVLFWNAAPRYVDAKNGIVDQLKKEGFAEPTVLVFHGKRRR